MDAQLTLSSMGQVSSARQRIGCSGYRGPAVALEAMDPALQMTASSRAIGSPEAMTLPIQLRQMLHSVDPETGAILFRNPNLTGLPDRVVEGDGYTMEFIGNILLCVDITDPGALGNLFAEPVNDPE